MKILLILTCAFLMVVIAVIWAYDILTRKKQFLQRRMEVYITGPRLKVKTDRRERGKEARNLLTILRSTGEIFTQRGLISKQLELDLQKADLPLRGGEYLAIWLGATFLPGSLFLLVTGNILATLVLYMLGILTPPVLVRFRQQKRAKMLNRQIGDTLVIISNALRAGQSFQQAMNLVSREMAQPTAKEFGRTVRELNLGVSLESALLNMSKRVGSKDLDLLITVILIQRQVGGNLAEVLDNIANTIRERIRIQGEIRTLTAQGRISGLIIGLIPPILIVFISMMNPGYLKPLINTGPGIAMLAAGAVAEVLGIIVIKKIVTIDF